MFNAIQYEGYDLNECEILNDVVLDDKMLCLRITQLTCSTCSDSILFLIKRTLSGRQLKNVHAQEDYFITFERLNHFIFTNIIKIRENYKISPLDDLNVPYFFIIDERKIAKMIFIPERDYPEETEKYISMIRNQLDYEIIK